MSVLGTKRTIGWHRACQLLDQSRQRSILIDGGLSAFDPEWSFGGGTTVNAHWRHYRERAVLSL